MKFVRFLYEGRTAYGLMETDGIVTLTDAPWHAGAVRAAIVPINRAKLLAPVDAPRIFGAAYNYRADTDNDETKLRPSAPVLFMKPSTSVIGSGEAIEYPPGAEAVCFEGELAVVIGKRCRGLTPDDAMNAVFGYTIANDVTDWVKLREESAFGSLLIAKGLDTFCPLGPWIVDDIDPSNATIETRVNGAILQSGTTARLIFSVRDLLVYISRYVTLLPGDVILTGTPNGSGAFRPGDLIEIAIGGLGTLQNDVVEARSMASVGPYCPSARRPH